LLIVKFAIKQVNPASGVTLQCKYRRFKNEKTTCLRAKWFASRRLALKVD
jgi:hypothetical protein